MVKRRSRGEVEKGRHWACLRGGFIAFNPRNRALKSPRGPAKTDLEGPMIPIIVKFSPRLHTAIGL